MLPPPGKHWQYAPSKLEQLNEHGDIHWSRNGNPRRKVYWSSEKKAALTDYWEKFRDAYHQSIKITGYPTEKNLDMLKIIVEASSDAGDLVIDPYCGSGTTLQAARDLERRFIGVDASFSAAKATLRRMRYGVEPMGDYVNSKSKESNTLSLIKSTEHNKSCVFVLDSRLYASYEEEIKRLGRI